MRTTRTRAAAAAAIAACALILAGCNSTHQGPAGKVVGHDKTSSCKSAGTGIHKKKHCHTKYELTTQVTGGSPHEFSASHSDWSTCAVGTAYPGCLHN